MPNCPFLFSQIAHDPLHPIPHPLSACGAASLYLPLTVLLTIRFLLQKRRHLDCVQRHAFRHLGWGGGTQKILRSKIISIQNTQDVVETRISRIPARRSRIKNINQVHLFVCKHQNRSPWELLFGQELLEGEHLTFLQCYCWQRLVVSGPWPMSGQDHGPCQVRPLAHVR